MRCVDITKIVSLSPVSIDLYYMTCLYMYFSLSCVYTLMYTLISKQDERQIHLI